jgi:hypothetical protein
MNAVSSGWQSLSGGPASGRVDAPDGAEIAPRLFAFEEDILNSLRRFPMAMRCKLDVMGVRLSLQDWQRLPLAARRELLHMPIRSGVEADAFIARIGSLARRFCAGDSVMRQLPDPAPAWRDLRAMPEHLRDKLGREWSPATIQSIDWAALTDLERFALVKLSMPGHQNRGFASLAAELSGVPCAA